MATTYKLFAAAVSRETAEKLEKERFYRMTAEYALLYRRAKPRNIPCVEVKGADLRRLTEGDRLWLADCIAAVLAQATTKKRSSTAQRVSQLLDLWEKELEQEKKGLDKETRDNDGAEESDN
jgi:hypothetical protein